MNQSTQVSEKSKIRKTLFQLIAGAGSGAITKTIIAPLDRIKILHQIQGMKPSSLPKKYDGIIQTGKIVIQEEGVLSLYKGNGANVLRVIPNYALKFMFNDFFKDLVKKPNQMTPLTFNQLILSGSAAGFSQIILTYPLELVRTRLALSVDQSGSTKFKGIYDCFKVTIQKEGVLSLYKGVGPTIFSGTPYIGLQMTFYEVFKKLFKSDEKNILLNLLSGSCAGLVAQTITYPGDTLRRRMQTNGIGGEQVTYKNSIDAIIKISKLEGNLAFFKGLKANCIACIPGAAIQFVVYDFLKVIFGVN